MRLPFGRAKKNATEASGERGVLAFEHTAEVIRAETALKAAGFAVRVMGPPPDMRTGCDMVVEFPLVHEPAARRALTAVGITPLAAAPVRAGMLEPVSLYRTTDFGAWLMVRAANMKITVEKASGRIVNISGGGCPDVPALAELMVGRTLAQCPTPAEHGQTLCSYALELAFQEARRMMPSHADTEKTA